MNLDLLIKLVKLANNNPNEHEANSAARRACKLIAEGNFKFTADIPKNEPSIKPQTGGFSSNPPSQNDWFEQFFRATQQQREYSEKFRQPDFSRYTNPYTSKQQEPLKSHTIPCIKCWHNFTVNVNINPSSYVCYFCSLL